MISSNSVRVDINNADGNGLIRMSCKGTVDDIERFGIELIEGGELRANDGEIEFTGVVRRSMDDGMWRLEVSWKEIFEKHSRLP